MIQIITAIVDMFTMSEWVLWFRCSPKIAKFLHK